jgi:hypothetical protein
MQRVAILSLALAGSLLGAVAQAHEGGAHARGTVKEISAERIVLTTAQGAEVAIPMAPSTRILRGKKSIQAAEVRLGERAVVHAASRDGKLEAEVVMLGVAPP